MRALVAFLLTVTALAGCMAEEPAPVEDEPHIDPAPTVELTPDGLTAAGITVDAAALIATLQGFASDFPQRKANHADHVAARDWLAAQYDAIGYEVWRQPFEAGIPQENICGIKWGRMQDSWVIVGGHYDMTDTPGPVPVVGMGPSSGIYDDGSGTIMTLEMAKAFSAVDADFTIAFCGFDGEERGLQGSGALADTLTTGATDVNGVVRNITMTGMLDLDMIGLNWPGVDVPIFYDDNSPELQAFVRGYADAMGVPEDMLEFRGISAGRSDYAHFFALGVPTGFMISDFESWQLPGDVPADGPAGQYPFWHRFDTWETMVLMAGSEADVVSGFQVAVDLALASVAFLALDASVDITGEEK